MQNNLYGKKIIIAGALGSVGLPLVRTLSNLGAIVLGVDLKQANNDQAKFLTDKGNGSEFLRCDLVNQEETKRLFREISNDHPEIFAVIHTIGIAGPKGKISEIDIAELKNLFEVNVISAFNLLHFSVPLLQQGKSGRIILIGSVAGKLGYKERSAYSASKWAMEGLAKSLAEELGVENVSVNIIAPGPIDSPPLHAAVERKFREHAVNSEISYSALRSQSAMGILIDTDTISNTAVFLLSEMSSQISGQSISVDGCTTHLI